VLALIASTFAEVDGLQRKYGISRKETRLTDRLNLRRLRFGSGHGSSSIQTQLVPSSGGYSKPDTGTALFPECSNDVKLDYEGLAKLDTPAEGLDRYMTEMEEKARQYQETLSSFQKYQWAVRNRERLQSFIDDLRKYMDYLDMLTSAFLQCTFLPSPIVALD
jgi:hypothetical protein